MKKVLSSKSFKGENTRPGDHDGVGYKTDAGKLRFDLIPPDSLSKIAEVFTHGYDKYPPNNWRKGMLWSRVLGATWRHITKWMRGNTIDPDSGCHHLAHAVWNLMVLMNYEVTHPDKNDIVMDDGKSGKLGNGTKF